MLTPSELDDVRELIQREVRKRIMFIMRLYWVLCGISVAVMAIESFRFTEQTQALDQLIRNLAGLLAQLKGIR
jgi:hypothetical protein